MTASVRKIAKIRTGGQSGVDRAAMDFAIEHGIPYCGWCPKGGWAEDYPDLPGLLRDYPELQETPSSGTEQRTKWNMREAMRQACRYACMSDRLPNAVTPSTKYEVRDADAILTIIPESSAKPQGTEVGLEEGAHLGKPMFTASGMKDVPEIRRWISTLPNGKELCVGGPRASECPEAYETAKAVLTAVLPVFVRKTG